jgi:hypothetical protein
LHIDDYQRRFGGHGGDVDGDGDGDVRIRRKSNSGEKVDNGVFLGTAGKSIEGGGMQLRRKLGC